LKALCKKMMGPLTPEQMAQNNARLAQLWNDTLVKAYEAGQDEPIEDYWKSL
jgi:hypothetical protein